VRECPEAIVLVRASVPVVYHYLLLSLTEAVLLVLELT
jgi:hypothetical protein